jgi:hypothetical protein
MSKRGRRRALAGAIVLTALVAPPAQADEVTDWNRTATDALIANAAQGPTVSMVHLAMVQGAVYDAVNSIDGSREPYLADVPADGSESTAAAAATAAYRTLVSIVPAQQPMLQTRYLSSIGAIAPGPARDGGIAVGEAAAAAMIADRKDDGRFGPFRFTPGTAPGQWRPELPAFANDPAGWIARMRPFLLERGDQFGTPGPNALTSDEYARDFREVKRYGTAAADSPRSPEQTDIARFWYEHPTAMWSRIFRSLADERIHDPVDSARFYAMLDLTAADAVIACWYEKARWSFWRPISAIRAADTDGNPATTADPGWLPLLNTPPYPDHPAGHPCLTGAVTQTLRDFFRTDKVAFAETSAVSGTERRFSRFSQALREVVDARVYSGIHFRTGDRQGAKLGDRVAHWRKHHYFGVR